MTKITSFDGPWKNLSRKWSKIWPLKKATPQCIHLPPLKKSNWLFSLFGHFRPILVQFSTGFCQNRPEPARTDIFHIPRPRNEHQLIQNDQNDINLKVLNKTDPEPQNSRSKNGPTFHKTGPLFEKSWKKCPFCIDLDALEFPKKKSCIRFFHLFWPTFDPFFREIAFLAPENRKKKDLVFDHFYFTFQNRFFKKPIRASSLRFWLPKPNRSRSKVVQKGSKNGLFWHFFGYFGPFLTDFEPTFFKTTKYCTLKPDDFWKTVKKGVKKGVYPKITTFWTLFDHLKFTDFGRPSKI